MRIGKPVDSLAGSWGESEVWILRTLRVGFRTSGRCFWWSWGRTFAMIPNLPRRGPEKGWWIAAFIVVGGMVSAASIYTHYSSDRRAADAERLQKDIYAGVSDLRSVIGSPSDATQTKVLSDALATLRARQQQIDRMARQLADLRRTARPDNRIFANGMEVGVTGQFSYDQAAGKLLFAAITSPMLIDFSKELEFQSARIKCEPTGPGGSFGPPGGPTNYYRMVSCSVLGKRPDVD